LVKCHIKEAVTTGDRVDADWTPEDCALNSAVSQRLITKRFAYLFDFKKKKKKFCEMQVIPSD